MTEINPFYLSLFLISFLLTLIYIFRWHKHFDTHMTVVYVLIPIICVAYIVMYSNKDPQSAMGALKIIYVGACYLPWMMMLCVAELCDIKINRVIRIVSILLNTVIYAFVLTIGRLPWFYKSLTLEKVGSLWVIHKEYGPMHTAYSILIILYLVADLALIFYSYKKKKHVSRRILLLLFVPIPITMVGFFLNRFTMSRGIEIVPLAYIFAQVIYLFITQRMAVYNVSDAAAVSMVESGDTGFITVDYKKRYLGSNETARAILPDLNTLTVDGQALKTDNLKETLGAWIDAFEQSQKTNKTVYYKKETAPQEDDKIYAVNVNYLYDGKKKHGYQIVLTDDTQNRKYIDLLDKYNSDLQNEVAAKTERIVQMHDRLIMGLATMVESRDNSTGGHIRRTSEGVRILIEQIQADGELELSDNFCKNIIKAAPMHDLGKIAVDDAVLRKAGSFTPEEREKMKMHAAEGARIVHEILRDTDDEDFRRIAENVAHYHHERVDGSGYPDGLKGDRIPLEARIMAVADVYDALVSRRVYKEKFSFEKADAIILEGMGTQFDPDLCKYYIKARPKLIEFYSAEQ